MCRLYCITYEEDGEECEAVIPEWMLPEIEVITDIMLAGDLVEGYKIVEDKDPDDGEHEPIPIKTGVMK